jgi:hypothetical protein
MTTVRTVAAHEVVRAVYPRTPTEQDHVAMAVGKAIDATLSRVSYEAGRGRGPSRSAMQRLAAETLDDAVAEAAVPLSADDRARELATVDAVVQAFRRSEVMGLARPRSRLILVNERWGIYAQPDYWDGRGRFYEMKSYHATPTPPDVVLQLRLFQAAFPTFRAYLASFDRHAHPVTTTIEEVPPLAPATLDEVLALGVRTARASGVDKVLEYIDVPVVRYVRPETDEDAKPAAP